MINGKIVCPCFEKKIFALNKFLLNAETADLDPDRSKEVQNMPTKKIMGERKPTLLRKVLTQRFCSLFVQIRFGHPEF